MNLLKKWNKREHGRETAPARRGTREERGMSRLRDEMDRAFERVWRDFDRNPWSALSTLPESLGSLTDWPAIDMAEDEQALKLRIDVPGLDAKDVDVEVSGNLLTVRGQRRDEWSDEHAGLFRRERRCGSFTRAVTLPDYVDPEKIDARYDKGTLTLTVPKVPGKGPRRVRVTT